MKAVKGNKVYTIDESSKARYQADGFDISDDEGKVIAYGAGKKASYEGYQALKEENERLKELVGKSGKDEDGVIGVLNAYADEHGIDLGKSSSVSAILKKIADAMKQKGGE